ncbi:SAV_915 family protein [Streptomyces misionensis]|uniref:SAV_915 family protein n=1 Tax=Streptomyces misionensis TaxID=67331 RepID=UPI003829F004
MTELRHGDEHGDEPEPPDRSPAGLLYVPVRPGAFGCATRLLRTPLGERTAVAFTSAGRLTATLGPDQAWIRLAEPALRTLTAPLGVTTLTVDPQLTAPCPAQAPVPRSRSRTSGPRAVGAVHATTATALVSVPTKWIR